MRIFSVMCGCVGLAIGASLGFVAIGSSACAAERDAAATIRPELGPPLQEAQSLIRERKFREALARLRSTDGVADKTPYETLVVEQTRVVAATAAGDPASAAKAYAALPAGQPDPRQRLTLVHAIGDAYYRAGDYRAAATWIGRYVREGGEEPAVRDQLPLLLYLSGAYEDALASAETRIAEIERAKGRRAAESLYRIAADSSLKLGDLPAYDVAMVRLVGKYPDPKLWAGVLARAAARPDLQGRLAAEVLRLKVAVGVAETPDYVALVEYALVGGLPGEAHAVAEAGFATGKLGIGAEAGRHARLRATAAKSATEDRAALAAAESAARACRDGSALVDAGMNRLGHGDAATAAALIAEGIGKGGLVHPEEASLHLAVAYAGAGQKTKAVAALQSVAAGREGAAVLAQLWLAYVGAP